MTSRPLISVCLAAYNGERFIADQLKSIVGELSPTDELIIVDDGSCDRTKDIVRAMPDDRIRLIEHAANQGILASLEQAIRRASGEIIFLSDQDDLWLPGKVPTIMKKFSGDDTLLLVVSDAQVIDAHGRVIHPSFFSSTGRFRGGILSTVVKNRYLGCTMAFRRRLVPLFLPFPPDLPMHDMWIGMIGRLYGRVCYLDVPLIAYRRHEQNASPFQHAPLPKMLSWRWRLVKNLAKVIPRNWLRRGEIAAESTVLPPSSNCYGSRQ